MRYLIFNITVLSALGYLFMASPEQSFTSWISKAPLMYDAATTRRSRLFFRKRAAVENTPLRERTGGTRASGAGSQVWT